MVREGGRVENRRNRRSHSAGLPRGVALKHACDDIKTYHYEAVAAQPGNLSAKAIDHWFWHETAAAKVFLALQQVCIESADKSLHPLGRNILVPRWVLKGEG